MGNCSRKKETEDMTSWDRESRYGVCVRGGREDRDGILGGCEEGFNERKVLPM